MITITSYYFWSDWTEETALEIDETKIHGIELYLRFDRSWHAVIIPVVGESYEASHQLIEGEVEKLLYNPAITILKIVNYAQTEDFIPELRKIFSEEEKKNE